MDKKIPSIGPSITEKEIELVNEAIKYGWYSNMNMHIDMFVKEFSEYINMKYCLPVSHCTAAIHLAMLSAGIKEGDEVIVPDITWVASAAPIVYTGAKPVFVDIEEKNWCISIESFKNAITEKTKAVVPVGLLGNTPNMEEIKKIAKEKNIFVIEDAAESLGAEFNGKKSGSFGDVGVFSFNATKLAIAGQGGVLATNDSEIYEIARLYSHHGIKKDGKSRYYWSNLIGYNYNWTNIQAALALAQLRRINELIKLKEKIFFWYKKRLENIPEIILNHQQENSKSTYWITAARLTGKCMVDKEVIQQELLKYNIDARPFFYPISSMPPYKKYCNGDITKRNIVSYSISPYIICLPSGMNLTEEDVGYVCKCLIKVLNELSSEKIY